MFQVGDRQFVTDSGLMVPAISLALRERIEAAMLSHGISRSALIGQYLVYKASHWSIVFTRPLIGRYIAFKASHWSLLCSHSLTVTVLVVNSKKV